MSIVAGSYQSYQNGTVSNQLTDCGKCAECVSVRVTLLMYDQKRFIYRLLTRHDSLPVWLVQTSNSLGGGKLCTGQTVVLHTQCC
jgi:hypothetical protein